ncbi:MAG: hypothetical protein IJK08_04030 [Prevotella sp.]|nr:hypothetical protein [Prevotella sp.]
MGKRIIINGADFSENGVAFEPILYISTYSAAGPGGVKPTGANGGWAWGTLSAPFAGLVNKTINFIRFVPKQQGTLNFYRCTNPTDASSLQLVTSMEILASEVGKEVVHIFEPVTLGVEYFVIGEANGDQGLPGYDGNSGGQAPWIGRVPGDNVTAFSSSSGLRMDIGYIDYQ